MNNFNETQILSQIQQLIDKNRCGIDGFFTDSKKAANDIWRYMQNENFFVRNEAAVEISFNAKSRAA